MNGMNKLGCAFFNFKTKHPRLVMCILVFIIIPSVCSLGIGYELKNDVITDIPTVIVNHDNSDFSRTFAGFIEDSQYFQVVEYADNDKDIENAVKNNRAYMGIIIPEGFYADMRAGNAPKILTVYDGATLLALTTSKTAMSEIVLTAKGAYMMNVFHGKLDTVPAQVMNLVTPIDVSYKFLFNSVKGYRSYLLTGMLPAIVQVGMAMQGAGRGYETQFKKRKSGEHLKVLSLWTAMGAASIILCLGIQYMFFDMPYRSSVMAGLLLTVMYAAAITCFGYIVGMILPEKVLSLQISAVLVLPTSLLGGYTYPIYGMPDIFKIIAKGMPFYYYGRDIRNLSLKQLELSHLSESLSFFAVYIIVEIALILFISAVKKQRRDDTPSIRVQRMQKVKPYTVILLIPFLFTAVFSTAFGPLFVTDVPTAVYDMDNSTSSRMVVDYLYESDVMDINEGFDSMAEIEEAMLKNEIFAAIILPEGFGKELTGKTGAEATVLIDNSNFMIGNNLMSAVNTIFSTVNAGVQIKLLEGGSQVPYQAEQSVYTLNIAERVLYNPQLAYFYYIFAGLMAIFMQQVFLAATIPMFIEEKHKLKGQTRQEKRKAALDIGQKAVFVMGLTLISVMICLRTAMGMTGFPMRGNILLLLLFQVVFLFAMLGISLVLSSLFDKVECAAQFIMFLTIPAFFTCGYAWTEPMMAAGFATVIKKIWPLYYFANPMKDIILKGTELTGLMPYLVGCILFAAVWVPLGIFLYSKKIAFLEKYGFE